MNYVKTANWLLLGLLMLGSGLLKLAGELGWYGFAPSGFLETLKLPAAVFLAWVLIILETGSGIAILAKWQLKYVTWIPVVILVAAAAIAYYSNISQILIHLTLASSYWLLGSRDK